MRKTAGNVIGLAIAAAVAMAVAQTPVPPTAGAPAFDAADVHASAPATNPDTFVSGGRLRGGRYDLRRATLLDLIRVAWGTDAGKVVGGPSWLDLDRFDVSALAPPGTPPETVNLMLQSLLADRFALAVHKDTRPLPAFVLSVGKSKPNLKRSDGAANPGCQSRPADSALSCRGTSMEAFAATLRRMAGDYLTDPVVDSTGLEGNWDFDLRWTPRSRILPSGAERTTIFDAVGQQLGLALQPNKAPTPVLVVDGVNRGPNANPADTARLLPPRSPSFEVATVRPSAPDERMSHRLDPGGRLEMRGFPLELLIATAWDVDWDHMDERIASAPKWIDSKRFDIVAKAPPAPDAPRGTGFIDEDLQLMLRALLTERFNMSMHYEDRPVATWNLTAVKPKLTKADPSNRTGCREAHFIAHDPRDLNPRLSRLIECRNITMAQFAQQLQTLDRVEAAFNQVVDETGLKGAWDFTLSFTPRSQLESAAPDGNASDPNGAVSFFDALSRQLGLKLEMQKRAMPVLVIDNIDEKPSDN